MNLRLQFSNHGPPAAHLLHVSEDTSRTANYAGQGGTALRIVSLLGVVVALLVVAGLTYAAAAGVAEETQALKAMGQVKSCEAGKLVVSVRKEGAEAVDTTFTVNDQTKVAEGDAVKTVADLKAGQHVVVTYTVAGETKTATMVKIMLPMRDRKAEPNTNK